MAFDHTIDDRVTLRQHYSEPFPAVKAKAIDHVDPAARHFIERAPFAVFATSGPDGTDASPRGGPPGFIRVLDEHRIAMGDLSGNRRLDSFENLLDDPAVGLLLMVPGVNETLRVNGRGCLTTDPAVLAECEIDGVRPAVAVGVEVEEIFLHCAKAFRRSGLWDPESWSDPDDRPRAGRIFKEHLNLEGIDPELIEADLNAGYEVTMWMVGGEDEPVVTD